MKYRITCEINRKKWSNLLDASPFSSVFQSPEYYDFLSNVPFLEPFSYGVLEEEKLLGVVVGYIAKEGNGLKAYFSRRAIVHGGLLLDEKISKKALETLLNEAKKILKSKVIFLEIRNYQDYSHFQQTIEKCGLMYQEHLNFHVVTPNAEKAFQTLNANKRRYVRLTIKNSATIITEPSNKELQEYYEVLSNLYKNKVKLPLFTISFFSHLLASKIGKFFLVKYNEKIIGGSVCVELKDKILYELFVCGLDREYKGVYPSIYATWAAIEYAANEKMTHLDMMGAGKPGDGYGVRQFKSEFGGELVEYGRYQFVFNPLLFKIGKMGVEILKKRK